MEFAVVLQHFETMLSPSERKPAWVYARVCVSMYIHRFGMSGGRAGRVKGDKTPVSNRLQQQESTASGILRSRFVPPEAGSGQVRLQKMSTWIGVSITVG